MAGKVCPNCNEQTFHLISTDSKNRECSNCGLIMIVPEKVGQKCANCHQRAVVHNECTYCHAKYHMPAKSK